MTCPDCKGTGKITLLTSVQPCATCKGGGSFVMLTLPELYKQASEILAAEDGDTGTQLTRGEWTTNGRKDDIEITVSGGNSELPALQYAYYSSPCLTVANEIYATIAAYIMATID